jgi:hypothetical protein
VCGYDNTFVLAPETSIKGEADCAESEIDMELDRSTDSCSVRSYISEPNVTEDGLYIVDENFTYELYLQVVFGNRSEHV